MRYLGNTDQHSVHNHKCHEPCLYYLNSCTPQYDWIDDYTGIMVPHPRLWTSVGSWTVASGNKGYYYAVPYNGKWLQSKTAGDTITFSSYRTAGQLFGYLRIQIDDAVSGIVEVNGRAISGFDFNHLAYYGTPFYSNDADIFFACNSTYNQLYFSYISRYGYYDYYSSEIWTDKNGYYASKTTTTDNITLKIINPGTGYVKIFGAYNINPTIDQSYMVGVTDTAYNNTARDYYGRYRCMLLPQVYCGACDNHKLTDTAIIEISDIANPDAMATYQAMQKADWTLPRWPYPNQHTRCDFSLTRTIDVATGDAYFVKYKQTPWLEDGCCWPLVDVLGIISGNYTDVSIYPTNRVLQEEVWRNYTTNECIGNTGITANPHVTPTDNFIRNFRFKIVAASGNYNYTGPAANQAICIAENKLAHPYFLGAGNNYIKINFGGGADTSLESIGFDVQISAPPPKIELLPPDSYMFGLGQKYYIPTIFHGDCSEGGVIYVTGCYEGWGPCTPYYHANSPTTQNYVYRVYTTDGTTLQASTGYIDQPFVHIGTVVVGHLYVGASGCNPREGSTYGETSPIEDDFFVTAIKVSVKNDWSYTDKRFDDCGKFNGTYILDRLAECGYEDSFELSPKSTRYYGGYSPTLGYTLGGCVDHNWTRFDLGFKYPPQIYYPYAGSWPIAKIDSLRFGGTSYSTCRILTLDIYKDAHAYGYPILRSSDGNITYDTSTSIYSWYSIPYLYYQFYRQVSQTDGFIDYNNPGKTPTLTLDTVNKTVTISPFIYGGYGGIGNLKNVIIKTTPTTIQLYPRFTTIMQMYGVDDDYRFQGCSGWVSDGISLTASGTVELLSLGGYYGSSTTAAVCDLMYMLQPGATQPSIVMKDKMTYRMNNPQRQMIAWPDYRNLDVNTLFFGSGIDMDNYADKSIYSNLYYQGGTKYTVPNTIIDTTNWEDGTYYFYTKDGGVSYYTSLQSKTYGGFYLGYQTYTHYINNNPLNTSTMSATESVAYIRPYSDSTRTTMFNATGNAIVVYTTGTYTLALSGIGTNYFDIYTTGTYGGGCYGRYTYRAWSTTYGHANETYIHFYIDHMLNFTYNTLNPYNAGWTPSSNSQIIVATVYKDAAGNFTVFDRRSAPTQSRHGLYFPQICDDGYISYKVGKNPMSFKFKYGVNGEVWNNGSLTTKIGWEIVTSPIGTGYYNIFYDYAGVCHVDNTTVMDNTKVKLARFLIRKGASVIGNYYAGGFGGGWSSYFGASASPYINMVSTPNLEDFYGAMNCTDINQMELIPYDVMSQYEACTAGAASGNLWTYSPYNYTFAESDNLCSLKNAKCLVSTV